MLRRAGAHRLVLDTDQLRELRTARREVDFVTGRRADRDGGGPCFFHRPLGSRLGPGKVIAVRVVVDVVLSLWWLVVLVLLALRWVDSSKVQVVAVQCALPVAGASLGVLLGIALMRRRWILTVAATVLLVPLVLLAWPWWFQPDLQPAGENDIVVMTSNILLGSGDIAAVDDAVQHLDVDALVLLEITPQALARVEASGIPEALPHRSGEPRLDADGTMVFTARPHERAPDAPDLAHDQVVVQVEPEVAADEPWVLFGAHPEPPTQPRWSADLAALHDWEQGRPSGAQVVMAGDFNASAGHPSFRRLTQGLTDTHRRSALGWVRTWPKKGRIPAFVQLDHVLVRELAVVDAGQVRISGSDHDAVWARLSP